jgi:hypothetical protein
MNLRASCDSADWLATVAKIPHHRGDYYVKERISGAAFYHRSAAVPQPK